MYTGDYLTGDQAAAFCGVSRRTVYRWAEEGRIETPFRRRDLLGMGKRARGPKRKPYSKRYLYGRHNPHGRNWQKGGSESMKWE